MSHVGLSFSLAPLSGHECLIDVMLFMYFDWRGECKPTMYLPFYYLYYMGCCEDCLTCDIAFNAVMSLSRASTRGSYSRIEGVIRHLLSLLTIYVEMPCPSIINTYSICHHTMFFHSNVILVHQTSKRKRVIAEPEGAPAKSLKTWWRWRNQTAPHLYWLYNQWHKM